MGIRVTIAPPQHVAPGTPPSTGTATPAEALPGPLQQIATLLQQGRVEQAWAIAHKASGSDLRMKNAQGVCLLRMGKLEGAVRHYRNVCIRAGQITLNREVPAIVHANFALALLASGQIVGCEEILSELGGSQLPLVKRLRKKITDWKASLSWGDRLRWWLGGDVRTPLVVDFEMGELV